MIRRLAHLFTVWDERLKASQLITTQTTTVSSWNYFGERKKQSRKSWTFHRRNLFLREYLQYGLKGEDAPLCLLFGRNNKCPRKQQVRVVAERKIINELTQCAIHPISLSLLWISSKMRSSEKYLLRDGIMFVINSFGKILTLSSYRMTRRGHIKRHKKSYRMSHGVCDLWWNGLGERKTFSFATCNSLINFECDVWGSVLETCSCDIRTELMSANGWWNVRRLCIN